MSAKNRIRRLGPRIEKAANSLYYYWGLAYKQWQVLGPTESSIRILCPSRNVLRSARDVGVLANPIWLRSGTSDVSMFNEVFIEKEYDFEVGPAPRVIVDAGANIGLTSLWYSALYPEARIVAVEAELSNYELLVRNTAPYPNITAIHSALWWRPGKLEIQTPPGAGTAGFRTAERDEDRSRDDGTVDALTIPDLLVRENIETIDLLKIDIEGAEYHIFRDGRSSDWIDRVGAITIELHDRFLPGCSRAFYAATSGFPIEMRRGFTTFVSRA